MKIKLKRIALVLAALTLLAAACGAPPEQAETSQPEAPAQTEGPAPEITTEEPQTGGDGSQYWVIAEDPRTGIRFAVPCFWVVDAPTPEQDPSGVGFFPIQNFTQEFAESFGDKQSELIWEKGAMKIDFGYLRLEMFNLAPGADLEELVQAMFVDETSETEQISTTEVTINGQPGLQVTTEITQSDTTSSSYLIQYTPDLVLVFSAFPPEANDHPDIQSILNSLALTSDVEVQIPSHVPAPPPEGVPSACLEGATQGNE